MKHKVSKSDEEWRKQLTPEQYKITREQGTEPPFTGEYWDEKRDGVYRCVCCGEPLFSSEKKYDSGSGWPSFTRPIDWESIGTEEDTRGGRIRTEIHCRRCGCHLGHVFDDGPPEDTGLRYCVDSASLDFAPEEERPA